MNDKIIDLLDAELERLHLLIENEVSTPKAREWAHKQIEYILHNLTEPQIFISRLPELSI